MLSMRRWWDKVKGDSRPQAQAAELSAALLAKRMAEGENLQIIDIRSAEAFAAGHIPGAVNLPLGELLARVAALDRGAATVVY
jgi:rhodanese-related sulfurtransferase